MPVFTIEMTSGNQGCPTQIDVEARTPGEAIVEALGLNSSREGALGDLIQPYDKENDPGGYYQGWSRIVISLDGRYEDGIWRKECDPPPTDMELLAGVHNG